MSSFTLVKTILSGQSIVSLHCAAAAVAAANAPWWRHCNYWPASGGTRANVASRFNGL